MQNTSLLNKTGIRRVNFYVASPVETCDRCSAGIKHVALVTYKDGFTAKYGSECINKILANAPDLRRLFQKNAKLLKRYTEALEIFGRAPEDMPRGQEYYGAGFYFIADSTGKDINGGKSGHWFFHPVMDWEKNQDPKRRPLHSDCGLYRQSSLEEYQARCFKEIEQEKPWFQAEIARIEGFLARILAKASPAEAASLAKEAE